MKYSKKKRIGIVVSRKSKKTAIVSIASRGSHSKYVKTLTRISRHMVHDEWELSRVGDIVLIESIAPVSRHKAWSIKVILRASKN